MITPDFRDQMQSLFATWVNAQKELGETWLKAFSSRPVSDGPDNAAGSGRAATGVDSREGEGVRAQGGAYGVSGEGPPTSRGGTGHASTGSLQDLLGLGFPWPLWPSDANAFSRSWLGGLQELYGDAFKSLPAPWLEAFRPPDPRLSETDGRSALSQFTDLYWDAYERTMGRLLESPDVGYRREFDERLLQTTRAWLEFRRASFDYLVVMGKAWLDVTGEMMSELETKARQGKAVTSLVEMLQLWTKVADRVLIEIFGREEYAKVQGQLLNASMAYRREERRTADALLKMTHVPSRSDLDELSRELHQLRREVRDLRKSAREGRTEVQGRPKSPGRTREKSSSRSPRAKRTSKESDKPAAPGETASQPAKGGDAPAPAQSNPETNGVSRAIRK